MVQSIFSQEEAEQILNIPPSKTAPADKMVWSYSPKGVFSVKNAYHVKLSRKKQLNEETSEKSEKNERWKSIWALKVTVIVKMFLWRAGNDLLATKSNLFQGKCAENPLYPICQNEVETVTHVLWPCHAATLGQKIQVLYRNGRRNERIF